MNTSKLVLIAIAVFGAAFAFIISWELLLPEKKAVVGIEEVPHLPGHQETRYVGSSIPKEERDQAGPQDTAAQNTPYGELKWERKPVKKKDKQPAKIRSTYDKEQDVVKPEKSENGIVQ